MVNSEGIIIELTDLPNYRASFTEPLAQLGVTTIDDLRTVLYDKERTVLMISAMKGLGPRTVQDWKDAVKRAEEPTVREAEEAAVVLAAVVLEPEETDLVLSEVVLEAEEIKGASEGSTGEAAAIPTAPKGERDLFCSMENLKEVQRTAIDLLHMNGSKNKALMASAEYVTKRLKCAGLDLTADLESEAPTIVASKGEGGIVLWGHLDTERLDGMKKNEQGAVQGDMIHGRGAANMKGAVAAMICAAERAATWQVPFSLVFTTDALDEQKGAEELAKSSMVQNSKGIIMFGPTGMRPVVGQAGYAAIWVQISGEGAVMGMATFLEMLSAHVEGSSGRLAVKIGLIQGGKRKRPFDPARSCEVMMELETRDVTDSAINGIEELLMGVEHKVEVLCRSEMVEFDRSSDLAKAVSELTREKMVFEMVHTEAAMLVPVNQKIVICGPGTVANALSDDEYVVIRELEETFELILGLVDRSAPQ